MCKITGKYKDSKKFTGYKLVYIIDGRYYSPVTGVEYKVGEKVQAVTDRDLAENNFESNSILNSLWEKNGWLAPYRIFNDFYEPGIIGKTGVFQYKNSALLFQKNETLVKMTISGNLVTGQTDCYDIVAGEFIESIELIDEG